MKLHIPITYRERETQDSAVHLLHSVLDYRYLGSLENEENSNIREADLRRFLKEKQDCTDSEADQAIAALKDAATCSRYAELYEKGLDTYKLLRDGISVSQGYGKVNRTINFIDWKNPSNNDFAVAQEVTVRRVSEDLRHRRPDMVVYVNGIALVVLELKRMAVSIADAIRQNRRNQEDGEICHFFTTVQLLLAGNESQGLKYGVTKTPEKFWLKWKEPVGDPCEESRFTVEAYPNEMFRSMLQMLEPTRLLEFIHDCIIYDGGIKKAARPNQYFALKAAKQRIRQDKSGIIWHSQGSGKSLTMIWLAQWIKEQEGDNRILIVTDRDELDKQIELGFLKTSITPYRAPSGDKLIKAISKPGPQIITTLIHKFGTGLHDGSDRVEVGGKKADRSPEEVMELIAQSLPEGFKPSGKFYIFVDECHRTQGGILRKAMEKIMGKDVVMIGFTGTPLLKTNKKTSLEQFGGTFIHTYKFDEAVRDGVILDLRYEARDVEQWLSDSNKEKIDRMFEQKTIGLTERAKEALKKRWATLQKLYSSENRMEQIVANICEDMTLLAPLANGIGNAMLVAGDVYQAYKYYDLFQKTEELKGKCCVVTSYDPSMGVSIKDGHSDDSRLDEETFKYDRAKEMMGDMDAKTFEEWAKKKFIDEPGQMKLIIVVDKLLTGFDAPKATFLYIDKHMEDHNLFQAICRVNRVSEDWKEFGYIIDYKDLFNEIQGAVSDYTNGKTANALSGFDEEDVQGLLKNRLAEGKKAIDDAIEEVENYVSEVKQPKKVDQFFDFFVYDQAETPADEQMAVSIENGSKREGLYNVINKLINRYLAIATQMVEAGYTVVEAKNIHRMISDYAELRDAIMLRSGDLTDLKQYNAIMRKLLDRYVQAEDPKVLATLEDFSFLDLIDMGEDPRDAATKADGDDTGKANGIAETITANVRKYIVRKRDQNPDFYDKLSDKLNRLLEEYRQKTIEYRQMLEGLMEMIAELKQTTGYPAEIDTPLKKALYDNLEKDTGLVILIYETVKYNHQPNWRELKPREKSLRIKIKGATDIDGEILEKVMRIVKANNEF